MKFLKKLFKKHTTPTYPTATERWDALSEDEKDNLRYFQKNMFLGLGLNEDGTKKIGPSAVSKVSRPAPDKKKNRISVDETINLD